MTTVIFDLAGGQAAITLFLYFFSKWSIMQPSRGLWVLHERFWPCFLPLSCCGKYFCKQIIVELSCCDLLT